jgi:hypothetical protein
MLKYVFLKLQFNKFSKKKRKNLKIFRQSLKITNAVNDLNMRNKYNKIRLRLRNTQNKQKNGRNF